MYVKLIITFYNMTNENKYAYLMKTHWKKLNHYITLGWDNRTVFYIKRQN